MLTGKIAAARLDIRSKKEALGSRWRGNASRPALHAERGYALGVLGATEVMLDLLHSESDRNQLLNSLVAIILRLENDLRGALEGQDLRAHVELSKQSRMFGNIKLFREMLGLVARMRRMISFARFQNSCIDRAYSNRSSPRYNYCFCFYLRRLPINSLHGHGGR